MHWPPMLRGLPRIAEVNNKVIGPVAPVGPRILYRFAGFGKVGPKSREDILNLNDIARFRLGGSPLKGIRV